MHYYKVFSFEFVHPFSLSAYSFTQNIGGSKTFSSFFWLSVQRAVPQRRQPIGPFVFPYNVIGTSIMAAIRSRVTPTCLLGCLLRQTGKPNRGNSASPDVWNYVGLLHCDTTELIYSVSEETRGQLHVGLLAGLASLRSSTYDIDSSIDSLQHK